MAKLRISDRKIIFHYLVDNSPYKRGGKTLEAGSEVKVMPFPEGELASRHVGSL